MNTIDQRILIPAAPDTIWALISDMARNPEWQRDCREVTFLTTANQGAGLRYRATNARGRQYIVEVSAWYENVGYAYRIVDGLPYKENRGTIRLQEIAEGTIVQWMFEYELSGMLSGVRNAVSTRRNVENTIIESLETLWKVANTRQNDTGGQYISKSLMREAPDVEARSNYVPRHPSKPQTDEDEQFQKLASEEPPVEEEDTRPTRTQPIVTADDMAIDTSQPPVNEPDFLDNVPAARQADEHAAWQPPAADKDDSKPDTMQTIEPVRLEPIEEEPATAAPPKVEEAPSFELESPEPQPVEEKPEDTIPEPSYDLEPVENPAPSITDTSTVSVFDLFGVPKPSETQQMQAVQVEDDSEEEVEEQPLAAVEAVDDVTETPQPPTLEAAEPVAEPEPIQEVVEPEQPSPQPLQPVKSAPHAVEVSEEKGSFQSPGGRVGMRVIMRRRLIKVRRP